MIENLLFNFGALGIVAYVVYSYNQDFKTLVENNTRALNRVEFILSCEKKKE